MNDKQREQLSAFMDGEAESHECDDLVKTLCRHDAEDERGCWERYHLIGDALKKNLPDYLQHDLSARVSAALADEPTILAPRRFNINWHRYSKPLIGAAIAASVASVSIVGLRVVLPEATNFNTVASQEMSEPALAAQDFTTVAEAENTQQNLFMNDKAMRLNGYLVNHSEFSNPNGIQTLPPYLRVVGQGEIEDLLRAQE